MMGPTPYKNCVVIVWMISKFTIEMQWLKKNAKAPQKKWCLAETAWGSGSPPDFSEDHPSTKPWRVAWRAALLGPWGRMFGYGGCTMVWLTMGILPWYLDISSSKFSGYGWWFDILELLSQQLGWRAPIFQSCTELSWRWCCEEKTKNPSCKLVSWLKHEAQESARGWWICEDILSENMQTQY